jgi:hypothetical protein
MNQVAFIGEAAWSVIDHCHRESGLLALHPLPSLDCPAIDISQVSSETTLSKILKKYIKPTGVTNLVDLVQELEKLGAVVVYPSGFSVAGFDIQDLMRRKSEIKPE